MFKCHVWLPEGFSIFVMRNCHWFFGQMHVTQHHPKLRSIWKTFRSGKLRRIHSEANYVKQIWRGYPLNTYTYIYIHIYVYVYIYMDIYCFWYLSLIDPSLKWVKWAGWTAPCGALPAIGTGQIFGYGSQRGTHGLANRLFFKRKINDLRK